MCVRNVTKSYLLADNCILPGRPTEKWDSWDALHLGAMDGVFWGLQTTLVFHLVKCLASTVVRC